VAKLDWLNGHHWCSAVVMGTLTTGWFAIACTGKISAAKEDDGGRDAGSEDAGSLTFEAFCAAAETAFATQQSSCLGGAESIYETQLSTVNSCTRFASAITAGRITYDPSTASDCLRSYFAVSCTLVLYGLATIVTPPACATALVGTVPTGGTCFGDFDCSGSSYCNGLGGVDPSCSGTCGPRVPAGGTCQAGDQCASGLFCIGAGDGQSCAAPEPPVSVGADCQNGSTCAAGLACDELTGVCATNVKEGGSCNPAAEVCEPFTMCEPTSKTCVPWPALGAACTTNCLGAAYCATTAPSFMTGTCAAQSGAGAPCSADEACLSENCGASPTSDAGACKPACTQD
jgi:hypothetical protein